MSVSIPVTKLRFLTNSIPAALNWNRLSRYYSLSRCSGAKVGKRRSRCFMSVLISQSEGIVIAWWFRKIQRTSSCIVTISRCKKSLYIFSLMVVNSLVLQWGIRNLEAYCEDNVIQKKHTIKGYAFQGKFC